MNHPSAPLRRILIALLTLACLVSWWIFSRTTVDDAFITWRYGKNLIEAGVWNYNPSMLDPTQAYTNPIFALLSVVPQLFGMDVVLFFKLLSTILLVAFVWWLARITRYSWGMILLFFALPASFVHVYVGLETFLYAALMTALLVALHRQRMRQALILTILLFLTRPESWLLGALVPMYFTLTGSRTAPCQGKSPAPWWATLDLRRGILCCAILSAVLLLYFAFHALHFGSILPNTFYAKTIDGFNRNEFAKVILLTAPLLITFAFREYLLAALIFIMSCAIAYSYATSNLAMNYFGRFYFHIFPPIYFFLLYYASNVAGGVRLQPGKVAGIAIPEIRGDTLVRTVNLAALIFFVYISRHHSDIYTYGTYYLRSLESHAAIGKTLDSISTRYGIHAFAIGDAGMAAYHSRLDTLDILALGSTAVARSGITPDLIDSYDVDLIAFFATPQSIHVDGFGQRPLYDWARENNFIELCGVLWDSVYTFRIWARRPMPEIQELCERSAQKNIYPHEHFFKQAFVLPPWTFWHE